MYKNIVPGLISLDALFGRLPGFYYSDNFNSYLGVRKKSRFHYRIFVNDKIQVPRRYDFRDAFFLKLNNKWYYQRKLGPINLKFCFDPAERTFSFNRSYLLVPFLIGDVFPVGLVISDFINLDLFLAGMTTFKGCAYHYNQKNICVLAPSNNGKTTLIKEVLRRGGRYIAEDIVLLDLANSIIYPNDIRVNLFAKRADKWLKDLRREEQVNQPQKVNQIFVVQNYTSGKYPTRNKNLYDFFHLWRVAFNINSLLRSYVFEENLRGKIDFRMRALKGADIAFKQIQNFDYRFLEIKR